MDALELLLNRQSYNQLTEPAPEGIALQNILAAATRVPDHGALTPWRFIIFQDKSLEDLGEIFAEAAELRGESAEKIAKARTMPHRAPLVIAVIADVKESEKIPRLEQVISAACAAQTIQMAAFAQGFEGIWRTGVVSYDSHVKQQLKLKAQDELVGFLYLGTAKAEPPQKSRPEPAQFIENW